MNVLPIVLLIVVVTACAGSLMQCHSDVKRAEMKKIECEHKP